MDKSTSRRGRVRSCVLLASKYNFCQKKLLFIHTKQSLDFVFVNEAEWMGGRFVIRVMACMQSYARVLIPKRLLLQTREDRQVWHDTLLVQTLIHIYTASG